MKTILIFLVKSIGFNKLSSIILAIPLSIWIADMGNTIEANGLNKWAVGMLLLGFVFDSFVGTYSAIITEGTGVSGTSFEWKKFLKILNKLILLVFLVAIAFITSLSADSGFTIFNIDPQHGGTFIISITAVTEIKSALKKLKKISNSPVIDLLIKLLSVLDEIVPFKKIRKSDGE